MGSEQNDGTSFQPSEPKPCANNCGFFGSAGTMNLCSKCYRDFRVREEQSATAIAAMEQSLNPKLKLSEINKAVASRFDLETSTGPTSSLTKATVIRGDQVETKMSNRCLTCHKKVGLTGFKCKCGNTFCGTHRYAENHGCTFDFKRTGRDEIAKANPVVKADKVERF